VSDAGTDCYTYSWSGTGIPDDAVTTTNTLIIPNPTEDINIVCTVTGSDIGGFVVTPFIICQNDSVNLSTAIKGLADGIEAIYCTNIDHTGELENLRVSPASTTTYYVYTTDGSCSVSKPIIVTVNQLPSFSLKSGLESLSRTCANTAFDMSTLINGSITNGGILRVYSDADCSETTGITGNATVSNAGTYYLRAENLSTMCIGSTVSSVAVTEKTPTRITVPPYGEIVCYDTVYKMSVEGECEGSPSYSWKRGAIVVGTQKDYTADKNGIYTVEVSGVCGAVSEQAVVHFLRRKRISP
jgi:hypothetical protein